MKSARFLCLVFSFSLFLIFGISNKVYANFYETATKDNFLTAIDHNLSVSSSIRVQKNFDGTYFFYQGESTPMGPSCCGGDLLSRVDKRIEKYGYAIVSKKTSNNNPFYYVGPLDYGEIKGGSTSFFYGGWIPFYPGIGYSAPQYGFGTGYQYAPGGFTPLQYDGWITPGGGMGYPYISGAVPSINYGWGAPLQYWGWNQPWAGMGYPYNNGGVPTWGAPYFGGWINGYSYNGYEGLYNGNSNLVGLAYGMQPLLYTMPPTIVQSLSGNPADTPLPTVLNEGQQLLRHAATFNPHLY